MGNYYEILGVRPDASVDVIEKAYRDLAVKHHPDRNPADPEAAKRRFQQLQQIFETLRDPERRYYYNEANCRLQNGWFLIPIDAPFRGMTFLRDGSFQFQQKRFSAEDSVDGKVSFEGSTATATVHKAPGIGEELAFSGPGVSERYRFHNGRWYCWTPMDAATKAKAEAAHRTRTSSQRGISTIVYTADDGPPSPEDQREHKAVKKRSVLRVPMTAAALLLAAGAGWGLSGLRHTGANPGTLEDRQRTVQEQRRQFEVDELERQQRERELSAARAQEAAESQRKVQIARNRDRLLTLVRRGDELLKLQEELRVEAKAWEERVLPLLRNEDGKKLATQEQYVRTFMAEYSKRRLSPDAISALRVEIETLLVPLREASKEAEPSYDPSRDVESVLSQKRKEIEDALSSYKSSRSLILSLVNSISAHSDKTLDTAINDVVKADELARASRIARETADARARLDQLEADSAKQQKEAELAHQSELAHAAQAEEGRKLQKLKDRTEAQSAEVRAALAYFFAKDVFQPVRNSSWEGMESVGKAQPISLSRLQTCGALNNDQQGLQTLLSIVTNSWDKSRPLWGVSASLDGLTKADSEKLVKAQDYLNRLGPTLVELGLLSE